MRLPNPTFFNAAAKPATTSSHPDPAPTMADLTKHLVVPGQVIAMSSEDEPENAFLRGHGTYVDTIPGDSGSGGDEGTNAIEMQGADADPSHPAGGRKRLIASVAGVIERVNKLVSVVPVSSTVYSGQVGDLIVGRISSVGATRWKVGLAPAARSASSGGGPSPLCRDGQLPLSGVDLPGGVQRIRTAEDARGMRMLYTEGDLLSAEVQQVTQSNGTLLLHTRSLKYGKLENGVCVQVPPGLVRRMRQHMCTLPGDVGIDVLIGCNGGIWIQRSMPKVGESGPSSVDDNGGNGDVNRTGTVVEEDTSAPLAETLQKIRKWHASTPVLPDERENIVRVRNAIECLRMVHCYVTPDNIMKVYEASKAVGLGDMTRPDITLMLTEGTRSKQ